MQVLSYQEIVDAARDYYNRKLLSAQAEPASGFRLCAYLVDGTDYRCAIGAALTLETLAAINEVDELTMPLNYIRKFVTFASDDDFDSAYALQDVHDKWCNNWSGDGEAQEAKFRKLIGLDPS